MRSEHVDWAMDEFGSATLGDKRRTTRLVTLAAQAAASPAGRVTDTCRTSAAREGAFRFVENRAICPREVIGAMARAAARRCVEKVAIVAVDSTSLLLRDEAGGRGLGAVGSFKSGGRGAHVMSAFALTSEGAPLGICAQSYWVREQRSKRPDKGPSTDVENRETRFWLRALEQTSEIFATQAPGSTPWFQLDRGADCGPVLAMAKDSGLLLTVRATHDRCVAGPHGKLMAALESTKPVMTYTLSVTAKTRVRKRKRVGRRKVKHWVAKRQARVAKLVLRYTTVMLQFGGRTLEFNGVLVREKNRPKGDRVEWLLLTTRPIATPEDALEVVRSYSYRWRIEEFHRTWKRGLCCVEDTQLRSFNAVVKWATILAAVAARSLKLTYLARKEPDLLASAEFTKSELRAIIVMREAKGVTLADIKTMTLSQAIRWIADLGGYIGPRIGPPGPTVVARGLRDVLIGAKALRNRAKMR